MGRKNLNNEVVQLADAAADPTSAGELQRNGADLKFHDGTAARTLVMAQAAPDLVPAADATRTTSAITPARSRRSRGSS